MQAVLTSVDVGGGGDHDTNIYVGNGGSDRGRKEANMMVTITIMLIVMMRRGPVMHSGQRQHE